MRVLVPMLPALTRPSIRKRLNSFDILNGCTSAHPPGGCSEAVGRLGGIAREGGLRQTHAGRAGARRQTGRPRQLGRRWGVGLLRETRFGVVGGRRWVSVLTERPPKRRVGFCYSIKVKSVMRIYESAKSVMRIYDSPV